MNLAQRLVLAMGAMAIAAMALLPPWNFVYTYPGDKRYLNRPAYQAERFAGYYPMWKSNTPTDQSHLAALFSIPADERSSLQYFSIELNTKKLLVQLSGAILMTIVLTVLTKSIPKRTRKG